MKIRLIDGRIVDALEVRDRAFGPVKYFVDAETNAIYTLDEFDSVEFMAHNIDNRILDSLEILGEPDDDKKMFKSRRRECVDTIHAMMDDIAYADYTDDKVERDKFLERVIFACADITAFCKWWKDKK